MTLRPTFTSLPTPFGGHSPRLTTLRSHANFSIVGSYGSLSADVSPSDANAMETPQPFLKNSSLTTGLNLTVHLLGVGLMALPWAFSVIGWAAVLLVVFLGGAHAWGAVLLVRSGRVMHFTSSYSELSDTAFGFRGRTLLFILTVAQQCLDQVIYLHLFGVTLASINSWPRLSSARGHAQWLVVATVFSVAANVTLSSAPACGLAFADMSRALAVVGALASITLTLLLVGDLGSQVLELLPLSSTVIPDELLRGGWALFRAFGSVCYCFAGQAALPSLVSSMKHPQQAEAVVLCTHGLLTFAYLTIGVFGLVLQTSLGTYGDAYLYWFQENSGLVWWDVGLKACIITVLCTKSVLALQPLVDSVVDTLRPRFDAWFLPRPSSSSSSSSLSDASFAPSTTATTLLLLHTSSLDLVKRRRIVKVSLRLALRIIVPTVVLLLGLFLRPLDNLVSLINLAGCVSVVVTVIVPCLLALELLKEELGWLETFCAWLLVSSASTAAGICVFFYCWG